MDQVRLALALRDASVLVGPMNPAELREAVIRPAAAVGLIVARDLTARIVAEVVREPGGLPLMSHALLETWRRRRGRTLTVEMYEAVGGIHGAVAATAEALHAGLSPDRAAEARRILLRLVTPGKGAQDTRRPADRAGDPTSWHRILMAEYDPVRPPPRTPGRGPEQGRSVAGGAGGPQGGPGRTGDDHVAVVADDQLRARVARGVARPDR